MSATGQHGTGARSGDLSAPLRHLPRITGSWPRLPSAPGALSAFGVYLALALLWYRAAVAHMGSSCTCVLPGDAASIAWALEWYPHALIHGLNLLHAHAMWTPTGINLAGATAVPLLAFLVAPVTAVWGPVVAYNVLTIAAPVTGAWACFWLCRYVTRAPWASILAGAIYGFGTYEIAQNNGHLQMAVTVVPPLLALAVLRHLQGRTGRRRLLLELSVLLLAQMFIGLELLFTMSVLGACAMALAWLLGNQELRTRLVATLPVVIGAYLIVFALSSWYVYAFLHAPNYNRDIGFRFYPTDLLSFVTPMPYSWVLGGRFAAVSALFPAGPGETDAYLGLPLILVVAHYLTTHWQRRSSRWIAATLAVAMLWVLGVSLEVAGKPTVWLPYALIAPLPGFNAVMQGRVALYITLLCAVVLAMWLSSSRAHPVLSWTVALLALAFVLPNLAQPFQGQNTTWTNPSFFRTGMYMRYLRRGETIMPIAWGGFSESPMWQAEDHMYWNMANGYFLTRPPSGWADPLTTDLWLDRPRIGDWRFLRPFTAAHGVSAIIVQSAELQRWAPVLRRAGLGAPVSRGGVALFEVPASWRASAGGAQPQPL